MHLKQPGLIYGACGSFTKNKERIKKFKGTRDSRYFQQSGLGKGYFLHSMAYGDFNNLTSKAASDKILRDEAFNIVKTHKYDGYKRSPASMVYKFFDKTTSGSGIKNKSILNKELAEELHKPIIRKFEKAKVNSPFIDNILGADLADMQLISKSNELICYLLCVIENISLNTHLLFL